MQPHDIPDDLIAAYEARTAQVYEARSSLGAAVHSIISELGRLHADLAAAQSENRELRAMAAELRAVVADLESQLDSSREVVATLRNMKVVRWTVWPRRAVYRLRDARRRPSR